MYISTPCPKCKKRVCIDLTITEKLTPATAESTIKELRDANNEQEESE